jgi:hypothetical protein
MFLSMHLYRRRCRRRTVEKIEEGFYLRVGPLFHPYPHPPHPLYEVKEEEKREEKQRKGQDEGA